MAEKTIPASVLRIAGEFVVIVVGVLVALAADSYMESQGEAARANAAIPLLIEDLEADSVRMTQFYRFILPHDTVYATLLMTPPDADVSADSIAGLIRRLSLGQDFGPSRSTYESLLETDGVRHLGDLDLQTDLIRYYQQDQFNVVEWFELYIEHFTRFQHLVGRHTAFETTTLEEGLRVWTRIPMTLATSWDEIRSDAELMSQIGLMNTYEGILGGIIATALEENAALRRQLLAVR